MNVFSATFIALLVLKLLDVILVSWWVVTAPLWVSALFVVVVALIYSRK